MQLSKTFGDKKHTKEGIGLKMEGAGANISGEGEGTGGRR